MLDNKSILLHHFKRTASITTERSGNIVLSYNRVSSKDQMENGNSLEWQQECLDQFAQRSNLIIKRHCGGTFESAKNDERAEFKKMIDEIKKDGSISAILVYSYDRFSRSGANGIFLIENLRKLGVKIIAVTQPVEAFTPTGMFQENLYMLLSKLDNDMRRDKSVMGTKSILRKGYWPYAVPRGYENKNKHARADRHEIVINKDGYLIKQAFKWKAAGKHSNMEIVKLLAAKGLSINIKNLAWIFSNLFYCGYIVSSIIPDELIKGKHPALIDENTFMKVNHIVQQNPRSGIFHHIAKTKGRAPFKSFCKR